MIKITKKILGNEDGFVGAAVVVGAVLAGSTAITLGASLVVAGAIAVAGAALSYLAIDAVTPEIPDFSSLANLANSPTYSSDRIGNTISEGIPAARCYGKCKIGGNKLRFNEPDATDLRLIVGHCVGVCNNVITLYVNDLEWSTLEGAHTKTTYLGTRVQTVDARFSVKASAYRSIVYTAFTFAKDDKQVGYSPNITTVMEGLLCAPLAGGADVFTRNVGVILYDWYLNVEGYTAGELDLNAFKSLEALCNEVPAGGTIARYRFDFNIDTNMAQNDAKKVIWSAFNGRAIMSQGKIKPVWDSGQEADGAGGLQTKTVSHAFDLNNIVKDSLTWQQLERPNLVRVYFKDSAKGYKTSTVEIKDENDINENGEYPLEEKAWFITDGEIARRRARHMYNRKRYADYATKFTALSGASDIEVLDLVTITHVLPGWTTKQFIITSRSEDALGRMQFTAEAYYSGAYDDGEVGDQSNFASDLPNPRQAPSSSTGISAAMTAVGTAYDFDAVRVSFTPPQDDPFYAHSEVYASNDDATYYYVGRDSTGEFTFNALGVIYEPGDTCYIKIRSVSESGVPEDLPGVADTSVLVSSTMRLGGFYAGLTFFGDNATEASAKILLDKTNTLMRLGPTSAPYLVNDGDYSGEPAVYSSNYVSGVAGAGFLLKSDLLEVGNIAARGMIRTAVFQKDVVSAVGGNLAVLAADVLETDTDALDESLNIRITEGGDTRITEDSDTRITVGVAAIEISGSETFSSGDILRIKDGLDDEWLEVVSASAAPVYLVQRDKAGDYSSNSNPAWKKGASVVNYGQPGAGGIFLTSSESNAPYISIFTHEGEPWDTITTRVREGNLNGYAGYSSDIYGWASYVDADNYIKIDAVNGIRTATKSIGPIVDVKAYGAVGDGVTDDTVAIQAAIDAANDYSTIYFSPPSVEYKITDTLTISKPLIPKGDGQLTGIKQDTAAKSIFYVTSGDVTIEKLHMYGPQHSVFVSMERAVRISGVNNSPAAPTYVSNIRVQQCVIENWGDYGIEASYVDGLRCVDNVIVDIYYAGIGCISIKNSFIRSNSITNIIGTPNAYGAFVTRTAGGTTLTAEPRADNVDISGNYVEGVLNWEGLDTHAGRNIRFVNNTVINCARGIICGSDNDATGPSYCLVSKNTILNYDIPMDEVVYGITVDGLSASKATQNKVDGNLVYQYGDYSAALGGALYVLYSDGTMITNNEFVACGTRAILMSHSNTNFMVSGNIVETLQTDGGTPNAIEVNAIVDGNSGVISNNLISVGAHDGIRISVNEKSVKLIRNSITTSGTKYILPGYAKGLIDEDYHSRAWVKLASDQSITTAGSPQTVLFATETEDIMGEWASNAFTPKNNGWYSCSCTLWFAENFADGDSIKIYFYVGGSVIVQHKISIPFTTVPSISLSHNLRIAYTQALQVKVYHDAGITRDLDATHSNLMITKISGY